MDIKQLSSEFSRVKEQVERLDGQRGGNRAVKQSDLKPMASYGMKSPTTATGVAADDYAALREDIAKLYELIAKVANLYGTAAK